MRTLYSNSLAVLALSSATRNANAAVNGVSIDLAQYGNNSRDVVFVVTTGAITDGTHAFTVEESDSSGSGFTAVESTRVLGSLPSAGASDDNVVFSFGVRPTKRYVRLVATTAGATSGGVFSAVALLGNGNINPVARA